MMMRFEMRVGVCARSMGHGCSEGLAPTISCAVVTLPHSFSSMRHASRAMSVAKECWWGLLGWTLTYFHKRKAEQTTNNGESPLLTHSTGPRDWE